jgi:hypothetical protein
MCKTRSAILIIKDLTRVQYSLAWQLFKKSLWRGLALNTIYKLKYLLITC